MTPLVCLHVDYNVILGEVFKLLDLIQLLQTFEIEQSHKGIFDVNHQGLLLLVELVTHQIVLSFLEVLLKFH